MNDGSSGRSPAREAFMLAAEDGHRFCLLHHAAAGAAPRGGILYVHPFAEEMNKSRRAVAVTARRLALSGWSVLQIDLAGCGDSSGDIGDATWSAWQDDVCRAASLLATRGITLKVLWGLRLGALLATSVLGRLPLAPDLLLWQPVVDGSAHLTQFLRLKAAEQLIAQSSAKEGVSSLKAQLKSGTPVQVAGYTLPPALANAIESARLTLPTTYRGTIDWLETGRTEGGELQPASARVVAALSAAGHVVIARGVGGPAFWQTVEIEEAPALVGATIEALDAHRAGPA